MGDPMISAIYASRLKGENDRNQIENRRGSSPPAITRQPLHLQHRLRHSLHPEHQLILNTLQVGYGVIFCCDACSKKAEEFMYSCTECNFDLHKDCALQVGSCTITNDNTTHLQTFANKHLPYNTNDGTGNPTTVVGSSLQTVIRHSLHPQHQLEYSCFGGKIGYYSYGCDACQKKGEGFRYCCKECNFDLHKECAAAVPVGSSSMILQASARKDEMTKDDDDEDDDDEDDDDVPYAKIFKKAFIKGAKVQLMEEVKDKVTELLHEDTIGDAVLDILQGLFM